jgi:predicted polyphosphate/ATP-dependent NAD kinase
MENDIDRLIKEREELEDRCMKLTDENKALLRDRSEYTKNLENLNNRLLTENAQFANALWPLLEQKFFEEIKIMVDDQLGAKIAQVISDGELIFREWGA